MRFGVFFVLLRVPPGDVHFLASLGVGHGGREVPGTAVAVSRAGHSTVLARSLCPRRAQIGHLFLRDPLPAEGHTPPRTVTL